MRLFMRRRQSGCLNHFDADRAGFVAGLAGIGVEGGESEDVGGAFVHGEEDFALVHVGGEVGFGGNGAAAGGDGDFLMVGGAVDGGVIGGEVEEEFFWVEFPKDGTFVGTGLGVPLGRVSATC